VPVVDQLEGAGIAVAHEVHELLVGQTLEILRRHRLVSGLLVARIRRPRIGRV
jgi:hypothetical protein